MQITEQGFVIADQTLSFADLPAWIHRHPQGIERALALEDQARRVVAADFPRRALKRWIGQVCSWGGYPRTAERLFQANTFREIQRRFQQAWDLLDRERPLLQPAARELTHLRHLGLSFASKHLRLLRPAFCPILDSLLSEALGYPATSKGYRHFAQACHKAADRLEVLGVENPVGRPTGAWYAADVEMGLYVYVKALCDR